MTDDKFQALYGSFKRLRDFPLDPSCIFDSKDEMEEYIAGGTTAYAGQVVVVLTGDRRGIYYIINNSTGLSYVKALDLEDEEQLLSEFAILKADFNETKTSLNTTLANIYQEISDNFVSKETFEKITNLDASEVEGIIDSLGEVILILNDFNNALLHSSSFQKVASDIGKIRKLIPTDLNDSLSYDDFNPSNDQILVTNKQLNDVKDFVKHSERVASFEFGENKDNISQLIGDSDNGFTITQVRIVIDIPASGPLNTFELRIDNSQKAIVRNSDIDFSENATFIYDMEEKTSQKTAIECTRSNFLGASGRIFIKYFE